MTTLLIVDDHPALRLVLKAQLSQVLGITAILEADNGQDTIKLVRQASPGLVMLDIDIPKVNGLDVIPRIRAIQPSVRILVISGQDQSVFAPRVKEAGANGYISKQRDMAEIIHCVEAVLAGYTVFPALETVIDGRISRRASETNKLELLSDKELIVMQMLARGLSNKEIGVALFISNKTVSTYKTRILTKLNLHSLVELVDFARKCHISP